MFNYLPMFIFVACVSFYLGVRIDSYRWRQRCNVMLTTMETMQKKLNIARGFANSEKE